MLTYSKFTTKDIPVKTLIMLDEVEGWIPNTLTVKVVDVDGAIILETTDLEGAILMCDEYEGSKLMGDLIQEIFGHKTNTKKVDALRMEIWVAKAMGHLRSKYQDYLLSAQKSKDGREMFCHLYGWSRE